MKTLKITFCVLSICLTILFSCRKDFVYFGETNNPPIANAGPDQTIQLPIDSIILDGSASSDPDGTIIAWRWSKISGPTSFNILSATAAKTGVKNLDTGTYHFELKVKDNEGLFATDTILVNSTNANNLSPIAVAGNDTTIQINQTYCDPVTITITLNGGKSYDPDGSIVSYLWTGPGTTPNANSAITAVSGLLPGSNRFILKVTDNHGAFNYDTVNITILLLDRPLINAQLIQIGALSEARDPVVAAAGGKIVFAGGLNNWVCGPDYGIASSVVDIYDINTHTWVTTQLSIPRWGIAAVACGNKIFFAGGENGQWTAYDNVDIFDVSTNTWAVAHLSEPRGFLSAATIGNKVFFAGGYNFPINSTPIASSSKVDIYDLSTNQWSTANLSSPTSNLVATTAGNKIYFTGTRYYSNKIDIYDNSTNSWSTLALQYLHSALAGVAVDDNIYWAGGVRAGQAYAGKVEIKNIKNGITSVDCLSGVRWNAVLKNDNIVFLSAGNNFDIFNTITGMWSIGQLDQTSITASAAIISVNNTIYVGGGVISDCGHFSNKVCILSW